MTKASNKEGDLAPPPEVLQEPLAAPSQALKMSKTPLYSAFNAARYTRQQQIRELDTETGSRLLCYIATTQISSDDVMFFADMLHNVPQGSNIDLMLQTPGGDVDAAEKLIGLLVGRKGDAGKLRVIVPDKAKSAGTLIALGGDSIVMSDSSELGTIDPQYFVKDENGNEVSLSVLDYLLSYDEHAQQLRDTPNDPVAKTMLSKFDPAMLRKFNRVKKRAQDLGENLLKRQGLNYTKIISELLNVEVFPSHGQMISAERALLMGLNVERMSAEDPLWQRYWQLYCHYRVTMARMEDITKIFESAAASNSEN